MLSAVVPSLLLLWYFYSRDIYPEPHRIVWTTFALGVATIPGVYGFGWIIDQLGGDSLVDPYAAGAMKAVVYAAVPEEALKLAVLLAYVRRQQAFDEPMDGLVYGVAVSLGFATLENILYVRVGGLDLALVRAFTALPCHATLGAIMGFYVGRATFAPADRLRWLVLAFVIPTGLHALYDLPLLTIASFADRSQLPDLAGRGLMTLVFGVLGFAVLLAYRMAQQERQRQPTRTEATRELASPVGVLLVLGFAGLAITSGALLGIGGALSRSADDATVSSISPIVLGVLLLAIGAGAFARAIALLNGSKPPTRVDSV